MNRVNKLGLGFILLLFGLTIFPSNTARAETSEAHFTDFTTIILDSFTLSNSDRDRIHSDLDNLSIADINQLVAAQITGQSFVDRNIEDNYIESSSGSAIPHLGSSDSWVFTSTFGCESVIRRFGHGRQVDGYEIREIRVFSASLGSCVDITGGDNWELTDLDRTNENRWFNWTSENVIVRVDGVGGEWVEIDPDNQPGVFFRSDEIGTNHQDYVTLSSGDPSRGELRINIDNQPDKYISITLGDVNNRNNPPTDLSTIGAGTEGLRDSCESAGSMGWILCPVINMLDGALTFIDNQIQSLLEIDENKYTDPGLKSAWQILRNIAFSILIPIMLIMVIGTAIGVEAFSAYTVKKALPRMVIAVIFIALSWYITAFFVDFFNTIGAGILGIITTPFPAAGNMSLNELFTSSGVGIAAQWSGIGVVTTGLVAAFAFQLGGYVLAIIGLFLLGALLFVLMAFLVLIARQMFIIALILVAPLAILAWIFPGNDKLWKIWWNTFSKLLMMFPLIMGVIAVGRVFAEILGTVGSDNAMTPFLKLTAYIIPYAAIPWTFKFAGGVFANLAGIINNKEKGLFDRIRNKRGETTKKGREQFTRDFRGGNLFKNVSAGSRRARFNTLTEGVAHWSRGGFATGERRQARIESALATANLDAAHQAMKENQELAVLLGNEDYAESGRSGRGYVTWTDDNGQKYYVLDDNGRKVRRDGSERAARAYLRGTQMQNIDTGAVSSEEGRGYSEEDLQSVMHARRGLSQDVFNVAATLSIPGTGTGFAGGAGEMDAAINETAGNNRRLASAMLAEMRSTADRAGRADLKGAGFGGRRTALEAQYRAEFAADQALANGSADERSYERSLEIAQNITTDTITDATVYSTDGRGIAGMKPKQIEAKVVPKLLQQLNVAYREGDQQLIDQQLAKVASLYDQAQYSSPEVQKIISDLMSAPVRAWTGQGEDRAQNIAPSSVLQEVESARGRETFTKFRRELGGGRMSREELAGLSAEERQRQLDMEAQRAQEEQQE